MNPMHRTCLVLSLALLLAGILFGSGCTSAAVSKRLQANEALLTQHILQVDAKGQLIAWPGSARSATIKDYMETEKYLKQQIIAPLQAAVANRAKYPKGVVIFIHGGLNTTKGALDRFIENHDELEASGYYPVFVLWPSGLPESYFDHLLSVRQGQTYDRNAGKAYVFLTIPLVLTQDILTGVVRTPMVAVNTLFSDVQSGLPVQSYSNGQVLAYTKLREASAYQDRVVVGNDYQSLTESVIRLSTYVVTLPAKIATGGLVIDAFGRPAWDNLKRRTLQIHPGRISQSDVVLSDSRALEIANLPPEKLVEERKKLTPGGFTAFVQLLESAQRTTPTDTPAFELTLIGHSMGTIVLNHMLSATTLEAKRITYLAAACSVRDFNESVLPYLAAHRQTQFANVMLNPKAETGELQKKFLDLPPRGSLLVWIDDFLSNPVHEQDRTMGRWTNLFLKPAGRAKTSAQQILDSSDRVSFYAFNVGSGPKTRGNNFQWNGTASSPRVTRSPEITYPKTHGSLSELPYWTPETLPPTLSVTAASGQP